MRPQPRTRGRAPSPSRVPMEPHRIDRAADFLRQGATVEEMTPPFVVLVLNGSRVMCTEARVVRAARQQLAPHSSDRAGEGRQ